MKTSRKSRSGSALLLAIVISFIIIAVAGAYLGLTIMRTKETERIRSGTQALYIAESAAASFIFRLNSTGVATKPNMSTSESIVIGKDNLFLGGGYTVTPASLNHPSGKFWLLEVEGKAGSQSRRLEVILSKDPGGVFWNAIFAGNSSGSDDYTLGFNSAGTNKDIVYGDVYSGGKVVQANEAQLMPSKSSPSGSAAQVMYGSDDTDGYDNAGAKQTASPPNFVHGSQPNLDVTSMNYDAKAQAAKDLLDNITNPDYDPNFVNVTASLEKKGKKGFIQNGGTDQGVGEALQIVDENDPAHLFRKDPTDGNSQRVLTYGKTDTIKDDYFIEDATRKAGAGSAQGNWLGSDGGSRLNVQANGNDKAYFIDGNLWASNSPAFTFQFENNTGADMKMTWIVKGNVYLTDNLLYDTNAPNKNDALAIIAIEDPAHPNYNPEDFYPGGKGYEDSKTSQTTRDNIKTIYDNGNLSPQQKFDKMAEYSRDYNKVYGSGNVFFGDPGGGTTERFESFLYAQNNFYDHNLGGNGTNLTNIYGNMTAGNHVQIQRKETDTVYKPMLLTFDERIRNGLTLPGLPGNPKIAAGDWVIASWKIDPKQRIKK